MIEIVKAIFMKSAITGIVMCLITIIGCCRHSINSSSVGHLEAEMDSLNNAIEFKISNNNKENVLGSDISLKINIKNIQNKIINLPPLSAMNLVFYMEQGKEDDKVYIGLKGLITEDFKKNSIITLHPNEEFVSNWTLTNRLYLLPKTSGKYKFYAIYTNKMKRFEEELFLTGTIISNPLNFELD